MSFTCQNKFGGYACCDADGICIEGGAEFNECLDDNHNDCDANAQCTDTQEKFIKFLITKYS